MPDLLTATLRRGHCLRLLPLLLVVAIFAIPTQANGWQEPVAESIHVDDAGPTDVQIEQRLQEIYGEVEGLETVVVDSKVGVVTLSGQVLRTELADEAEELAAAVEGVVAVQNEISRDNRLSHQVRPLVTRLKNIAKGVLVNLPLLLLALVVVVLFWWLGGRVSRSMRISPKWAPNLFVGDLVRFSARLLLTLIGIMLAAEMLGATALLVSVLGGLGVVGLAVGFAIRDTVENFVASVLLSIRQPFGANEHVSINNQEGRVVRLTSRATILLDLDGNHVRIPNGTVYKSTILNYTRNPLRRFSFEVGVDTEIDPNHAQQLAEAALSAVPGVLMDPKPKCVVDKLGDSNVVLRAFAWINQENSDYAGTRSAGMVAVKREFEDADVTMPEPIYRLRVENMDPAGADAAPSQKKPEQPVLRLEEVQPDKAVEQQVEEHRDGSDLLSTEAPRE